MSKGDASPRSLTRPSATLLCQLLLPAMKNRGWGPIANISCMPGKIGGLPPGVAYTAAKAGMLGLTKSVARAFIDTEMTSAEARERYVPRIPVRRLGAAAQVAAAVAVLAPDLAGYATGENFDLNGGVLVN